MHRMVDYLIFHKKNGLERSSILKVVNFLIFRDVIRIFLNFSEVF